VLNSRRRRRGNGIDWRNAPDLLAEAAGLEGSLGATGFTGAFRLSESV